MALTKEALDQAAAEYWKQYFGDYGKEWVRNIPRRVAQALVQQEASRIAERGRPNKIAKARIAPLAWAPTVTGGLTFEGVFRGVLNNAGKVENVHRMFAVEFDANGEIINLRQRAA